MMTDTIADMLTRIRNGNRIERPFVDMPATDVKRNIARVLKDEGFIIDHQLVLEAKDEQGQKSWQPVADVSKPKTVLRVFLKYGPEGEKVIRNIKRISKPGLRTYRGARDLKPVLDGMGIAILSTSKGVMSDRQARTQRLGGEVLCTVW